MEVVQKMHTAALRRLFVHPMFQTCVQTVHALRMDILRRPRLMHTTCSVVFCRCVLKTLSGATTVLVLNLKMSARHVNSIVPRLLQRAAHTWESALRRHWIAQRYPVVYAFQDNGNAMMDHVLTAPIFAHSRVVVTTELRSAGMEAVSQMQICVPF